MDLLSGCRRAMHAAADALRGLRRFGFCSTTANARTFLQLAFLSSVMTAALLPVDGASADVNVRIDLSRQQMTVAVDGAQHATWAVSTARRGYRTPVGRYRPYLLKRVHYSSIYDNAPMPYSIFFLGGYAIHGTTEVRNLGRAVSHGCIRLTPSNARALFGLVQRHGMPKTTITIVR